MEGGEVTATASTSTAAASTTASKTTIMSEENNSNCCNEEVDQQVFPPPSLWYKSTIVSARDDMWAYSGGGIIVVVRPPMMLVNGSLKEGNKKVVGVDEVTATLKDVKLGGSSEETEGRRQQRPSSYHDSFDGDCKRRWPRFSLMGEQRNRYNCLSFCQSRMDCLVVPGASLASGCEGGVVQIWNVEEKKVIYYHDAHGKSQIAGLDWSTKNPMLIYSIDEGGTLVVWNLTVNNLRSMNFGKIVPSCLQASPALDDIVAFGTRGGNIFIVNTLDLGTILSKVRHEEEVVSVMWKPPGQWDWLDESDSKAHVLASGIHSMKTPTIRVWNSRGKDLGVIRMSEMEPNHSFRAYKSFVPIGWIKNPLTGKLMLASSNRHGEICYTESRAGGVLALHGKHQHNAIFAVVQCGDIVWSLSFEPVIVGYNLRRLEVECIIPTFKGCTSLLPSPIDVNRVAVGGTDSFIRVLRCSSGFPMNGEGVLKSPVISPKLKGKVVCITWHPNKDNCIAFGTDEGAIGLFEVGGEHRHVSWFERRVHGVVYTVQFGPPVATEDYQKELDAKYNNKKSGNRKNKEQLSLFACGNGAVFMAHPSKLGNPLVDVLKIIQKTNPVVEITGLEVSKGPHVKATDILWTPDYSLFAVGFSDGRIELYSPPFLKLKCWIKCHTRAIQYLLWRPFDFTQAQKAFDSDKWLVTASNDGTTRLHNLKDLFVTDEEVAKADDEDAEPKMVISSEATLSEHGQRVISCAWSPHDVKLFVTVSYDSTAIVWNVEDGSHIARYMQHQQRLVACCFHPTHPYQVITASDELERDFALQIWDYRDHPFRKNLPRSKPQCVAVPIKAANEVSKILTSIQEKTLMNNGITSGGASGNEKKSSSCGSKPVRAGVCSGTESEAVVTVVKPKKTKTLLQATSNSLINCPNVNFIDEIQYLMEGKPLGSNSIGLNGGEGDSETTNQDGNSEPTENPKPIDPTLHLGLLESRDKCRKQLEFERNFLEKNNNPDSAAILSFWLDDSLYIEKCIKSGQVTEAMIPIAASIGRSMFLRAVESYASSMLRNQDYLKAGHYFYICGQHDKAIEALIAGKHFREAVALVKSTVADEDPRVKEVMEKWAKQLFDDGKFELATKIYCSIKEYSLALMVVEKRPHSFAYKVGCYIAQKIKDESKLIIFGVLFVTDGLTKGAYDECNSLLNEYPHIKWLETIVKCHETVNGFIKFLNEVGDAKTGRLWTMVMENCWDVLKLSFQSSLESYGGALTLRKRINECISVSIPQNDNEAMLIISKFFTLVLLGMLDSDVQCKALESAKLARKWIGSKNIYLYFAIVSSICKLAFSSLDALAEEHNSEIRDIFLESSVKFLKAIQLKTEILNPEKVEEMNTLFDELFQGPFGTFKQKYTSIIQGENMEELKITPENIPMSVNIDLTEKKPKDSNSEVSEPVPNTV